MSITILNQGNIPQGPFTREQVAQKLAAGEFTLESLAHIEGLSQWTPLRDVLAKIDATIPAFVLPATVPPVPAPAYSYAATMQPPSHLVYAGFLIRFVAYFIDSLIVGVGLSIVLGVLVGILAILASLAGANFSQDFGVNGITSSGQPYTVHNTGPNPMAVVFILIGELTIWGVVMVAMWLYFAKLEAGPMQATFGKRVMGIRVTDLTGQRISFGRASGRFFGKLVSAIPFDIGFIMAAFTERKQALHDMIAGTLVVKVIAPGR